MGDNPLSPRGEAGSPLRLHTYATIPRLIFIENKAGIFTTIGLTVLVLSIGLEYRRGREGPRSNPSVILERVGVWNPTNLSRAGCTENVTYTGTQQGSALGLTLCCHYLEFLNNFF